MNILKFFLCLACALSLQAHDLSFNWDVHPEEISGSLKTFNLYIKKGEVETVKDVGFNRPATIINLLDGSYTFSLTAVNASNLESDRSNLINTNLSTAITNTPTAPTNDLSINLSNGFINVYWTTPNQILQYSTNLFSWSDYPTNQNPVSILVYSYPNLFFRLRTNSTATNTPITDSSLGIYAISKQTNSTPVTYHSFTNIPAGSLLVLTTAAETAQKNSSVTSLPSIAWNKNADAHAASSGDCELFSAIITNGGNIKITNTWNTGSASSASSSVIYVLTNALGMGSFKVLTNQSAPSATLNISQTNSIIICVNSDWIPKIGAVTYSGAPVTEVLLHQVASKYQASHWYKKSNTNTSYTLGQTAPTGQYAGSIYYEIIGK